MRSVRPLITLCLLSSLVAFAGPDQEIAKAIALMDDVQEEKAIAVLSAALQRGDATLEQQADMNVLLAVAKFNLRDSAGAREAFRAALKANPAVSIPKVLPPKGWLLFEEARVERERERSKEVATVAAVTKQAETARPMSGRRIAGLVLGGAGAVAAGIGGVLMGGAVGTRDQAVSERDALASEALFTRAKANNQVGVGLLIAGAAVAVVGITIFVWPESDAAVKVALAPGGLGVSGRF